MRLVHLSICTKDSYQVTNTVAELDRDGYRMIYKGYDSADLDYDELAFRDMLSEVVAADFMTIMIHGDPSYFKKFGKLEDLILRSRVSVLLMCTDDDVTQEYRRLYKGPDEEYNLLLRYMILGGENLRSMLLWLMRKYDGIEVEVKEPMVPPGQGIYYPGRDSVGFEDFIEGLDPSKPNIGIMFYKKQWLTGNVGNIDGLIGAVERHGGNAVPIFLHTGEQELISAIGMKRVLMEKLIRDGRPVLDSIIQTVSHSMLVIGTPGLGEQIMDDNFLSDYGVPVIQAMTLSATEERWREGSEGLSPSEIAYDIVHPEFDGQIIAVPQCSIEKDENGIRYYSSIADRADRVAEMAVRWAELRRKPNRERKVALILYMYPPKNANAGGASGLDTFQSVVDLLHRMREEGYDVGDSIPETSRELVDMLLSGLTNDTTWISDDEVKRRVLDTVGTEEYRQWYKALSPDVRERMEADWGRPPGEFYVVDGRMTVPGRLFGNVYVGFQPDRGSDIQSNYHDPHLMMPHQYLAFYRWLKYTFRVDALVHIGTHGTLEWLPGKSVALSGDCCPDFVLDAIPDVYPYIIGNPGEGIQAKRRGAAVIVDHMVPTMTRAGGYDELLEAEGTVQGYMNAHNQVNQEGAAHIRDELRNVLSRMNLYDDMGLSPECSDEELDAAVDGLYDYIIELKGNLIKDGLHVLGRVPEGRKLEEDIYSLTRVDNGDIPSLRGSIARAIGFDVNELQNRASETDPGTGRLYGQILEDVETADEGLISAMAAAGFDETACLRLAEDRFPGDDGPLSACVSFICRELYPSLMRMGDEIGSIIRALSGEYIEPGPSGCPTRGRAQLLPTGRNFYSIDPEGVPWQPSWEVGRKMADQMLERYIQEHGAYPRTVGMVVWATDTMKTGGDDIAYILWLMGLRPVWSGYAGRVLDLEVIPLEELGRPRVDVTLRISGLFRDTFPNLVLLIDKGVKMIAGLDESDEENYLLANLRSDIVKAISEGIPEEEARRDALIRIFGDAPGTYGTGTAILIRTSQWDDVSDLGGIYQSYGQYAYGLDFHGEAKPDAFRRRLEQMEVTVKNSPSREQDIFDHDDVYGHLGGLNAAVRAVRGEMPMSFIGSSADTSNLKTRTIQEEGRYIFRSKIMNPRWLNGLMEHGFKGAQEISNMTEYVFAWDATSDIIDPWMYQSIAERFLFDEETAEWFRDANPFAMYETASRLLEAIGRGMWEPDEETRRQLEEVFMDLESDLEGSG